jgi:hypothetical protein
MAQPMPCEGSASGKPGEVIVSVDVRGTATMSWAVERREGVGEESDNFARPSLMLDFSAKPDGAIGVLTGLDVSVTRYSAPDVGVAPPLSAVRVQAKVGEVVVEWVASKPETGQPALVKRFKDRWPDELVIDIVDRQDKLLASATFDLSQMPAVQTLAREARSACRAG